MKNNSLRDLIKFKKFHASIIGFIVFIILIKLMGMKFFTFDLIYDKGKYFINTENLDYVMKRLFITNLKNIIIIFFILRLKHGQIYKYIIVCVATMISLFVFSNIFYSCDTVGNLFSMLMLYMPKYMNYFVYVNTSEKIEWLADKYNASKKISDEIKVIFKMSVVVTSIAIILSGIQTILALIAL